MAVREPTNNRQPHGNAERAARLRPSEPDASLPSLQGLVAESPAFREVLRQIRFVAPTESTILIQGETGTGKEVIARAIHNLSRRGDRLFIKLNCAALSHGLIEREIFGHPDDAIAERRGQQPRRADPAHPGTLCLEEIGDIPLELQVSLLRLLQERESGQTSAGPAAPVSARVMATTSRNLTEMVERQQFRIDLFYHINVFPIVLPPLRERREDIPRLARQLVASCAKRMNKQIETIPPEAMQRMMEYRWPGNIRELQNFIERAVILTSSALLQAPLAELQDHSSLIAPGPPAGAESGGASAVRFDNFEVDLRAGELRKRGTRIRLQEQPFRVLAILLDRPGEVVTREELQKTLWPADTFVDFDHGLNKAISKLRDALGDVASKARFVETVGRRGYRFLMPVRAAAEGAPLVASPGERAFSLAVLPFRNEGDPGNEFLGDGLTESIINNLSGLPKTRVIAYSTALRFKRKAVDPRAIGRELDVRAVLAGRVLPTDDKVSISVELVDVDHGWQLWGANYSRTLSEILQVKEEICREIAARLPACPPGEDPQRLLKRHNESPEAYRDYLRGRYYCNKMTEPEIRKGIAFFHSAIRADPGYALAYAGIADAYCLGVFMGLLVPGEAMPKAKEAALRALSIDESLAEAHASLACIREAYDWDWPGAEAEFQQALKLNPQHATARRWYADYLTAAGRTAEALREIQRALDLDPLSVVINNEVAWNYYMARQYDLAIQQCLRCIDMEPGFAPAHHILGIAYLYTARHDQAIAEIQKALELSGSNPPTLASLGYACAAVGRREEATALLGQLKDLAQQHYVSPYWQAIVHAGLGEKDQALECLGRCHAERGVWLIFLKMEPLFDNLRPHPRFQDLLRRVGFAASEQSSALPIPSRPSSGRAAPRPSEPWNSPLGPGQTPS